MNEHGSNKFDVFQKVLEQRPFHLLAARYPMLISSLSIILSGVICMSIVPHHRIFLRCKKQREYKLSMPLLPNCSLKSKRVKTDGLLAVVALWVTKPEFILNIPVYLCT